MQNYFNYFTEIEEHFQRRRGTVLLLSTLDWALIETWKDAGIPLEAVLSGIDAAMDRWERRPSKTRKVNSLAYCAQEVLAAAERMAEAAVGSERPPEAVPGLEPPAIASYLEQNAAKLEAAVVPEYCRALVLDMAKFLRSEAGLLAGAKALPSLEELERRLTLMEEKVFAALLAATPDEEIVQIRSEAERAMAPYRSKMPGAQIEQLHRQYLQKRLLETYHLPRLSLFYL